MLLKMQKFHAAEFEQAALPLVSQLYELAKQHNVAAVFSACVETDPEAAKHRNMSFGHLVGPARTPYDLVIANTAIRGTAEDVQQVLMAFVLTEEDDADLIDDGSVNVAAGGVQ